MYTLYVCVYIYIYIYIYIYSVLWIQQTSHNIYIYLTQLMSDVKNKK